MMKIPTVKSVSERSFGSVWSRVTFVFFKSLFFLFAFESSGIQCKLFNFILFQIVQFHFISFTDATYQETVTVIRVEERERE